MRLPLSCTLPLIAAAYAVALHADVVVSTTINLNGFTITPSSGSVLFVPPSGTSTFALAQDSLGGFEQQFGVISSSAATTLAKGNASASATLLTASASSSVNVAAITAFASSEATSSVGGAFEITGTSGAVNVLLSAPLKGSQSLTTNGAAAGATSEIIFSLTLPALSSSPELFYDNPLTIGQSSTLVSPYNNTLSTSLLLDANTPYAFTASLDSKSSGLNISPEPSGAVLTMVGFCALFVVYRRLS